MHIKVIGAKHIATSIYYLLTELSVLYFPKNNTINRKKLKYKQKLFHFDKATGFQESQIFKKICFSEQLRSANF